MTFDKEGYTYTLVSVQCCQIWGRFHISTEIESHLDIWKKVVHFFETLVNTNSTL